ncbi:hypothetical protein FC70_GL001022 [Paucilactobacillus oligofermentans DSM 15707 = LMG 22743]|uniref:Lipoprotein n=1 Tax=Paucilactobacillus oligofermentans DSM 15707 = LMG 22743 TaxID=1423778 RepID=A0A0R1RFV5_9LACO|nr:hypothetical protein [Paucilactobacillus oligofermentans]KRL55425.1 hypothetical protein FC70_GL001022 [Paucilactobacillus oligofermentans DSM 15707 = LMG 22743]CUS25585.1 Uncharacterized protein LACOL_0277 [Paucilactobacillus oligofermentans DSM 15707 = LMG 22743]
MKKLITIGLSGLLLVSLAGCGNSSSDSSDSSSSSSKSSKVVKNSSSNNKSNSKSSSSKDAANSSSKESSSSTDTTSLSSAQAVAWIQAHMDTTVLAEYNTGSTKFNNEDFSYNYNGTTGPAGVTDGAVYYQIRENHSSANMQAAGADPNTSSNAGWFRITSNGTLQYISVANQGSDAWTTVSSSYDA